MSEVIKFCCQRCGNCCRWPGYVHISQGEIDVIAAYLEMEVDLFIEQYTRLTDDRRGLSLIERDDGSCIFFRDNPSSCIINPVKPIQCRNFPLLWNFPGWEKECRGASLLSENHIADK